jgi:TATA-binding protein-associated factor Taf7
MRPASVDMEDDKDEEDEEMEEDEEKEEEKEEAKEEEDGDHEDHDDEEEGEKKRGKKGLVDGCNAMHQHRHDQETAARTCPLAFTRTHAGMCVCARPHTHRERKHNDYNHTLGHPATAG